MKLLFCDDIVINLDNIVYIQVEDAETLSFVGTADIVRTKCKDISAVVSAISKMADGVAEAEAEVIYNDGAV